MTAEIVPYVSRETNTKSVEPDAVHTAVGIKLIKDNFPYFWYGGEISLLA